MDFSKFKLLKLAEVSPKEEIGEEVEIETSALSKESIAELEKTFGKGVSKADRTTARFYSFNDIIKLCE